MGTSLSSLGSTLKADPFESAPFKGAQISRFTCQAMGRKCCLHNGVVHQDLYQEENVKNLSHVGPSSGNIPVEQLLHISLMCNKELREYSSDHAIDIHFREMPPLNSSWMRCGAVGLNMETAMFSVRRSRRPSRSFRWPVFPVSASREPSHVLLIFHPDVCYFSAYPHLSIIISSLISIRSLLGGSPEYQLRHFGV